MARGPGVFFILPCVDDIRIVDLRTVTCVVQPQEILTKDSVTVSVDAVVYHRVSNPMRAVIKVYKNSTVTEIEELHTHFKLWYNFIFYSGC